MYTFIVMFVLTSCRESIQYRYSVPNTTTSYYTSNNDNWSSNHTTSRCRDDDTSWVVFSS